VAINPSLKTFLANLNSPRIKQILNMALVILYLGFIFLWFKDNIYSLKKIRISYLVPLIPFLSILLFRLFLQIRQKKIRIHLPDSKTVIALLILLSLTIVLRLPFLKNYFGLISSDDAINALMAKHISEGKLAPVCIYGQLYMGSLSSHIFALFVKIFGYSFSTFKFSILGIYLAFIILQFLLLKEILPFSFSLVITSFYSLPLKHLVIISLDISASYALYLFLGSSLIYTAYLISYKKKNNLYALLGFLMGISFWTHQITAGFILLAFLFVALKARPSLKKYGLLFASALVGSFPLLLVEFSYKFPLLNFLFREKRQKWNPENLKNKIDIIQSLLSPARSLFSFLLLFLILSGLAVLLYLAFKKKELFRHGLWGLFFVLFIALYTASHFSDTVHLRYVYPLYFSLPILLFAAFLLFPPSIRFILSLGLIALLIILNWKDIRLNELEVKNSHHLVHRVISSLKETEKPYWLGNYWTAYLLTALTNEKIIVDSFDVKRYYPYSLFYHNQNNEDNYVFSESWDETDKFYVRNLTEMLTTLGINFKRKVIGDWNLVYDIGSPVFSKSLGEIVPSTIPCLRLNEVKSSKGYLSLSFKNVNPSSGKEHLEFRINAEIPGFSAVSKKLMGSAENVFITIPFPDKETFLIRYDLDYKGMKIPSSFQEFPYSPSKEESRKRAEKIVYLSEASPKVISPTKKIWLCEKEVRFEINRTKGEKARVRLILNSPFRFFEFSWYGNYSQKVKISVNGQEVMERILKDGRNIIAFEIDNAGQKDPVHVVTMRFQYHLVLGQVPLKKIAAILENLEVD